MTQRSPKEIAEEIYGMDLMGRKAAVVAAIAEAIEKAVLEEREACAMVAENIGKSLDNEWNQKLGKANDLVDTCQDIVETIRQRGERK